MNETVAASTNWMPWLVLAGIVLLVAWQRGLIKLPAFPVTTGTTPTVITVAQDVGHTLMDVSKLTSHELGVLFAQVQKREAELETANEFAKQAADNLRTAFKAPFASAAPAPADPQNPAPGV